MRLSREARSAPSRRGIALVALTEVKCASGSGVTPVAVFEPHSRQTDSKRILIARSTHPHGPCGPAPDGLGSVIPVQVKRHVPRIGAREGGLPERRKDQDDQHSPSRSPG